MTGGNHDERRALALGLNGADTDEPQDAVTMVRGLRIISLDSALPGFHHGGFSDTQYDWLSTQLAQPAEHGTILVMHHPPIRYRSPMMQLLDFEDAPRLRAALEGTDVRAILSGHLHVTSFGTLGTIPVFVAGGVSYVDDAGASCSWGSTAPSPGTSSRSTQMTSWARLSRSNSTSPGRPSTKPSSRTSEQCRRSSVEPSSRPSAEQTSRFAVSRTGVARRPKGVGDRTPLATKEQT